MNFALNRSAGTALALALGVGLVIVLQLGAEPAQNAAPVLPTVEPAGRSTGFSAAGADGAIVARAFAAALFSYDTSRQSRVEWADRLRDAIGPDERGAALAELEARLPSGQLWQQMAEAEQRAEFIATSTAVPRLWTETLKEHPELPEGALALTVRGEQQVTWSGGSSRAPVAVTLLMLCPPAVEQCVVARIPPQVAQ